ncbi:MAG: SDR family NAD(P)-dependent oxidoreductase [Candidatus Eisenbacteria bacterium]|uniref:SDR family NAD(P)-dependent oxidoreductase n=1 Tax=Eiseniibacteriota bacterium TaxID=2212470 RepID=A0A538T0P8_UNCEI|nr:MAG: SDR family NAD(P)-dependent oxidoreductase [Candidatus Eisenbacteria bacterium]
MTDLKGRWALVTGATSGFGLATARALAAQGCHVAITGRRDDRLQAVANEIRDRHRVDALALRFDVRELSQVRSSLEGARGLLSKLDIVVNNAGLALALDPIQTGDPADWDRMIDTNVKGLLYVTRTVLPGMVERGRGHIVNIGSVAGHQTYAGGAVYSATKYAVRAISDALRYDVLGKGVRVSNVEPGLAETEFSEVRFRGDVSRAQSVYEGMTPLRGEDVADAVVWCLTRPPHVNVQSVLILPTDQASAHAVHRRGK